MKISDEVKLGIAAEVAWIMGDNEDLPRAESRWAVVEVTQQIIAAGIIDEDTEDVDEVIVRWLIDGGFKNESI